MTTTVTLTTLSCANVTDPNGTDEVFLAIQADQGSMLRYPADARNTFSMAEDDDQDLSDGLPGELSVSFENTLVVTGYEVDENDLVFTNDFLGTVTIYGDSQSGSGNFSNGRDSDYTLNWVIS